MTLAELIAAQVAAGIEAAIKASKSDLTDVAVAGGDAAQDDLLSDVTNIVDIFSNVIGDIPLVGGLLEGAIDPIDAIAKGGGKFGSGLGIGYLIGYWLWSLVQPILLPIVHGVNAVSENEIYPPDMAAELAAKGIISESYAESEGGGSGFDTPHMDGMVEGSYNYPGAAEVLSAYNRGLIGYNDAALALQRNGIPETWIEIVMGLAVNVLSAPDLALATLRGDLDEATAQQMAGWTGVSPANFQTIMGNIGEPPGVEEMLLAFRLGYITEDQLVTGLKQSRLRDEWIQTIIDLKVRPMSPADAVNAVVQGHLDQGTAQNIAELSGLDPQYFPTLVENAGDPLSLTEMLTLWNRGQASQDDVETALKEGRLKDKYIPSALLLQRRMFDLFYLESIITAGTESPEWGVEYLVAEGYSPDDAAAYVNSKSSGATSTSHTITETMIVTLYQAGGIAAGDAETQLVALGYTASAAQFVILVADAQRELAQQESAMTVVRHSYIAGEITRATASNDLDAIGVPATQRDQVLTDWDTTINATVKQLTAGQITDAVKYDVWTFDQGVTALNSLGYSSDTATVLLAAGIGGLPSGVTAPAPKKAGV